MFGRSFVQKLYSLPPTCAFAHLTPQLYHTAWRLSIKFILNLYNIIINLCVYVCIYKHYLWVVLIFMNIRWLISMGGCGCRGFGLSICGLGCSATAQFHLTAQPSSNTSPRALIYRIPSIITLSAAIPDAGSPDFTGFSSGGTVYMGRRKISCDIILISCNDIDYVSYRITQD